MNRLSVAIYSIMDIVSLIQHWWYQIVFVASGNVENSFFLHFPCVLKYPRVVFYHSVIHGLGFLIS